MIIIVTAFIRFPFLTTYYDPFMSFLCFAHSAYPLKKTAAANAPKAALATIVPVPENSFSNAIDTPAKPRPVLIKAKSVRSFAKDVRCNASSCDVGKLLSLPPAVNDEVTSDCSIAKEDYEALMPVE